MKRFSRTVAEAFDNSAIIGVRAGLRSSHRFTGVWVVVVAGRVFARSWTRRSDGWCAAFLADPLGVVELGKRRFRVRAVRVKSARLLDAV